MINQSIKKDFPILDKKINGSTLVYLDNAATSQKPEKVIEAVSDYYKNYNANVHRGIHTLSEEATARYESARKNVAGFIGADDADEIVFTKGATESLNYVAFGYAKKVLKKGDTILLTVAEHHSNLIPWQIVAQEVGARLEYVYLNKSGEIELADLKEKVKDPTVKILAFFHASNVLGNILPVREICNLARDNNVLTVVDGCQAVPHMPINVRSYGCDFYAFSGHKMLGPMGIGVLYGRKELLNRMEPFEYGGGMINDVSEAGAVWAVLPEKHEAGTPNVEGAIGLSAAIDYLREIGPDNIKNHEIKLNEYAFDNLSRIRGIDILGTGDPKQRTGLFSFNLKGIHSHDVASVLNTTGVAVRSGHHCAHPLHKYLNLSSSVRASWYLYNFESDIDALVDGLQHAKKILG